MLTEIYIEALLASEDLADQVWEAWEVGEIDDQVACIAWMLIAGSNSSNDQHDDHSGSSRSTARASYDKAYYWAIDEVIWILRARQLS